LCLFLGGGGGRGCREGAFHRRVLNICLAVLDRHAISIFKVADCAEVSGREIRSNMCVLQGVWGVMVSQRGENFSEPTTGS